MTTTNTTSTIVTNFGLVHASTKNANGVEITWDMLRTAFAPCVKANQLEQVAYLCFSAEENYNHAHQWGNILSLPGIGKVTVSKLQAAFAALCELKPAIQQDDEAIIIDGNGTEAAARASTNQEKPMGTTTPAHPIDVWFSIVGFNEKNRTTLRQMLGKELIVSHDPALNQLMVRFHPEYAKLKGGVVDEVVKRTLAAMDKKGYSRGTYVSHGVTIRSKQPSRCNVKQLGERLAGIPLDQYSMWVKTAETAWPALDRNLTKAAIKRVRELVQEGVSIEQANHRAAIWFAKTLDRRGV